MERSDDSVLETLQNRCKFSETCLGQLQRESPRQLEKMSELLQLQEQYSREIREVASKELNPVVQEVLFAIAANHKAISDLSERFSASARQVTNELRRQKQEIIDPMKEVLLDRTNMNRDQSSKNTGKMTAYDLKQLGDKISHNEQLLRVNGLLFEKHRVGSIKAVLNEMLRVQLAYHCRAIELLTSSFEHLANLDVQASVEHVADELNTYAGAGLLDGEDDVSDA